MNLTELVLLGFWPGASAGAAIAPPAPDATPTPLAPAPAEPDVIDEDTLEAVGLLWLAADVSPDDVIDEDTLEACRLLWGKDAVQLPALLALPPQAGRLRGGQKTPYATVACERGREAERFYGGFKDYRKVTIRVYGTKAQAVQGLALVRAVFNSKLGRGGPGGLTLSYPDTDPATGIPRFVRWRPLNDGGLRLDPDVKAGEDVWIGEVIGEVVSARLN